MSTFTLAFKVLLNGRRIKTLEDITFYIEVNKDKKSYTIPAGFQSDLASIPRLLWAIFPPFGRYNKAALCHDWLYSTKVEARKVCDVAFKQLLLASKVERFKVNCFYLGVRLLGKFKYKK